jgi:hypothetical protein
MNEWIPIIAVVVYVILLKWSRHNETKKVTKQEQGVSDAENLVMTVMDAVRRKEPDKLNQVKLLNEIAGEVPDKNLYKRVLVDGITTLCETEPEKKFTPIKGTHPLLALANRAVESETKKAKRIRAVKNGVKVGAQIVKGVLF